ncbi:MAG: LysM peptidoglycan-binding domain-containing protein [Candidatus Riflebacteria bacterium]|nr:LysM peptidoglycan-binding domain-containing protein [Candidatus Riflebacteria bacterium]
MEKFIRMSFFFRLVFFSLFFFFINFEAKCQVDAPTSPNEVLKSHIIEECSPTVDPSGTSTGLISNNLNPASTTKVTNSTEVGSKETISTKKTTRKYKVVQGDCLSKIALKLLGDSTRYPEIIEMNKDKFPSIVKNPNLIYVGWELEIPEKSDSVVAQAPSQTVPTSTNSSTSQVSAPPEKTNSSTSIGPGTRVLLIGDSHTVGIYGTSLDQKLRTTGGKIRTIGVAGSSPSWWLNGTVTKCGYFFKDENGAEDRPADWRTPRKTPILSEQINEFKPTMIIISLGANLVGSSEQGVRNQCNGLLNVAQTSGASIVWVGPPQSRDMAKTNKVCEDLKKSLLPPIFFIDSRPMTHYPATGGDGIHYSGSEGSAIAKEWADGVFNEIQNSTH